VTLPIWSIALIGVVFLAVAVFAGVILFRVVEEFVATSPFAVATAPPTGGIAEAGQIESAAIPGETRVANEPASSSDPGTLPSGLVPRDRVNVLLLGIDQPCEFVEEPYRSDTLILFTVDPIARTAGMISIPRDLWVPIPGFGTNRINTAYRTGILNEYPGGGPALAAATVEYNLGVHIHHYITVNYDGFVQAVDLINGIDIDVTEPINDPDYPDRCYGYDPFYLRAGHHSMDGQLALKFARTRATLGADIDRVGRQQQVIMAALEKVKNQKLLLLPRAPELWNTFARNVTTDMTHQEAIGLATVAQVIPLDQFQNLVIGYSCVQDYTAPDGARVLVPIREKIRELIATLFSPSVGGVPISEPADPEELMRSEAARILVLNGTWTAGLASSTSQFLQSKGLTVVGVGDSEDKDLQYTEIIDYGGKPGTVDYLAQIMGIPAGRIYGGTNPDGDYDVKLLIGADWRITSE
jgi:LCP family protein required for cell wall assembly